MAALLYDSMLLFAVLFFATLILIPFTHGAIEPTNVLFTLYLTLICLAFYVGFWTHNGQTLGMKTWRLRVQQANGAPITLRQAAIRFFASLLSIACAGLGYLWILIDEDKKAWHDRLSHTYVVYLSKPKRRDRAPPQTNAMTD
jgi:uncharacterized RDD family membrane protein YckC